jgi:PrtD family type I secretion system ABC transporter
MLLDRDKQKNPLKAALSACRFGYVVVLTFGFVINMLMLAMPLYMIQVFDRVLSSQHVETLLFLTVAAGLALFILGVLETVRSRLLTRIGNWLDRTMSGELIRASISAALAGFDANAQALRDLRTIRNFITGGLKAVLDLPWSPLFIAALWLLHPWLGWFAIGAGALLLVTAAVNELAARNPAQEANSARVTNENLTEQAIRNADVIEAMGMLPNFLHDWSQRNGTVMELYRKAGDWNAALLGFTRFARLFAQVGILGLGAYLVIHGELTAGGMIAGSILLSRALAPLEQMIGAWRSMVAARGARKRIGVLVEGMPARNEPMQLPEPNGKLSCEDVWFAPNKEMEPTLKGIRFELEPGEVMALTGATAWGKMTLCKTLVGSWRPNTGHVRLDAADVHEEWPSETLGTQIGYLPQDVELFATTIKGNISRLAADPEPRAVVAAANAAGVHEMILSLPYGYDTSIGPSGVFLSGGQRQRIGLARALYGRPRLIVLDEPNSNLDSSGDEALVDAIEAAKHWGSTVIVVTHNPRILRPADKVMVLDNGKIQALVRRD